jgi:glutamate dehydrogenase (NAD(P)+)
MDLLPKRLNAELQPIELNKDRFSNNSVTQQESNYKIIDPETNKTWGYVCIDNTQRGPGLGGIRIAQNIGLNEISRLARAMTLKNSAACLPYGGGKSGLIANNSRLYNDPNLKSLLIDKFADALFELDNYLPAPDMGTDERDIQKIYDNHSKKLNKKTHNRGGVGRPVEYGGIPIDDWGLTAHGLFSAVLSLEDILENFRLNNSKIVVQGFGNVGCPTAIKLNEKGALIVGASDINGALWNSNGLDIEELSKIRKQTGGLSNYSKPVERKFSADKVDWLLEAPCDILIPAARPDAITSKNIDRIDCRLILQGANTPSSKPIEYYLKHRRNILSLTDFIVNAGGVIGCAVERKMIEDKNYSMKVQKKDTRTYTENLIFNTVAKNMKEIFSRMEEDYIFRDVSTDLAIERLKSHELWL